MSAIAVVLAAGSGNRLGLPTPKAFVTVGGRSILAMAAHAAAACPDIAGLVVTVPGGWEDRARAELPGSMPCEVVVGGASRHQSVGLALGAVPPDVAAVLCHDAARCLASPELFSSVLAALEEADGAVPVVPVPDTVKRLRDGLVVGTEPRSELGLAQTPQAFRASALRDAHRRAAPEGLEFTDDAAALEWAGYTVRAVPGEPQNFKITTREDLARADELARAGSPARRVPVAPASPPTPSLGTRG